jgi:hypothetical protein
MVSMLRVERRWSERSHGLGFYSPKAIPRKERGDWEEGFGFGVFGKRRSDGGLGRKTMV